ncbi:hypothetical protein [Streptomyces antnestii]|uniref:hypothetical protein n=1 Tax=Streptomyces antnestii TaxID=2494256 RepID=UPI003D6649B7
MKKETPAFGELARLLGCDRTNITGLVARLERRGPTVVAGVFPELRRIWARPVPVRVSHSPTLAGAFATAPH